MMQKTIFLFEDEATLAILLRAKLKSAGYAIEHAWDGEAGWQLLQQRRPDLLLLNVRMPKMTGLEVLQKVRGDPQLQDLPVMIVSNSANEEEAASLKTLGVSDYLVKVDFEPGELVEKVDSFFAKGGTPKKILIVEDDPELRDMVVLKLRSANYEVFMATEGQEGLDLVVKEKPDLILLDLVLPGMGGIEMLKRLRSNPDAKDIPVIILSNFAEQEHMEMVKPYKVVAYMAKASFFPTDIVAKVKQALG